MSLKKAKSLFVELVANVAPDQWDARLTELAGGDESFAGKSAESSRPTARRVVS